MVELRNLIEQPMANSPDDGDCYTQIQLLASCAVSLKRIADAMPHADGLQLTIYNAITEGLYAASRKI